METPSVEQSDSVLDLPSISTAKDNMETVSMALALFPLIPKSSRYMKLNSALEGGLAGATTIALITDTLRHINGGSSQKKLMDGKYLKKRFKKAGSKKPVKAAKQFIQLAGDILGGTAFLGLSSLSKKRNTMLRGGLLGTAAGLGTVFLNGHDAPKIKANGHEGFPVTGHAKDSVLSKALEVGLYTIGGLIAGKVIEGSGKKKKKK